MKVLVTFDQRSGDDEHQTYSLINKKDCEKSDVQLIKKAYHDIANYDDYMDRYWISDTDAVRVESKQDIAEDEIKVLAKFGIVYGVLEIKD